MEITQFRYKNDNCCKMLCQVQTAYIEIFDLSVFPIFTDIIIRRSKGKKSPAVYDLPFQLPNIYLLRRSRWLLLPGVVGLVIFFSDRNLWWRVAWALLLYFAPCCLLQNKFSGDQYIDDDTADEGTVSFQLWQAMINNIVKRSFHTTPTKLRLINYRFFQVSSFMMR